MASWCVFWQTRPANNSAVGLLLPSTNRVGKNKSAKKNLLPIRFCLSCNKDSCRTFVFLLSTRSDATERNATGDQAELWSRSWTELLQLYRQTKWYIDEYNVNIAHSSWSRDPGGSTPGDLGPTSLSLTAFLSASAYHSCFGLPRLFGFTAAATGPRCLGASVIMWAASRLHLEDMLDGRQTAGPISSQSHQSLCVLVGEKCWVCLSHLAARERCLRTWWQTGGQTPRPRWSSWDGCSGRRRNFSGARPETSEQIEKRENGINIPQIWIWKSVCLFCTKFALKVFNPKEIIL